MLAIAGNREPSMVLLNDKLYGDIKKKIVEKKREVTATKILECIANGKLALYAVDKGANDLPDAIPFFVLKNTQLGTRFAAVNLTNVVMREKLDDGSISYEIGDNINRLYVILLSAYLAVEKFDPKVSLPSNLMSEAAVLWAEIFNKPLYDAVGLNNKDRKDAYMYFAMKFFLVYFLDCDEKYAESVAMAYIGTKSDFLLGMIEKIELKGINIYDGVLSLLNTLINDEITSIRGLKVKTLTGAIDTNFYLNKFTMAYSSNAFLTLCSFPYFVFTVVAAVSKTNIVKDKSFDWVFSHNIKLLNQFIANIKK